MTVLCKVVISNLRETVNLTSGRAPRSTDNCFIGWRPVTPVASFAASLGDTTRHARSLLENCLKIGKHKSSSFFEPRLQQQAWYFSRPCTFDARRIPALIEFPVTPSEGRIPLMLARQNLMLSRFRCHVSLISSVNLSFTDAARAGVTLSSAKTPGSRPT